MDSRDDIPPTKRSNHRRKCKRKEKPQNKHNKMQQNTYNTKKNPESLLHNQHSEVGTSTLYSKKKRKKSKGRNRGHWRNSTASAEEPGTSLSTASEPTTEIEIPGFYYDSIKKKYFKILSGQNASTGTPFITRETVKQKQNEEIRIKDLKRLKSRDHHRKEPMQQKRWNVSNLYINRSKHSRTTKNICSLVNFSQTGLTSEYYTKCKISRTVIENLTPFASIKLFNQPSSSYEKLEHMIKMYPTVTDKNNLVCLWSLKNLLVQRIQTISVNSIEKPSETNAEMNVKTVGAMIPKAFSKVTSMCSASLHCGGVFQEHVLYTTMCAIGNNPSLAMLRNLNCSSSSDFRLTEFNLSSKATWCCAWNPVAPQFSVGTEKSGLLLDVETRKLWELNSDKSDVISQAFRKDGLVLFSGTRKGCVCAHDLRSRSTFMVSKFNHKSPVCHLYVSEDNNYIIASDFDSHIKKWDLRQRKVVLNYKGHNNEYAIIPFHVNNDKGILYSAGQDCYTRIWNINDGSLIRSIPPPHPVDVSNIPTLYYSSEMGKQSNRPGLLMGILDEIHFYSFS